MASDLADRRDRAARSNYSTDENLRRRQSLFSYVRHVGAPLLTDFFDWPPEAIALDLGCGNGLWTSAAVHRAQGGAVIALDVSLGMIEAVGQNAPGAIRVVADGHALPLCDQGVDVVIAAWVLYHLHNKPRALREIGRVLRPNGRLIASTNSKENYPRLDELLHSAVEETLGRSVVRYIEPLDFTLENGAEVLASAFAAVTQVESTTDFSITDADPVVALAASVQGPIEAEVGESLDTNRFLGTVRRRTEALLVAGPIEVSRRVAFFTATKYRRG
jgi:ubiquinone/menaquinone biosynthesis C-methylase UbiE